MNNIGRYLLLLAALLVAVIPASAQEGIYGLSAEDTQVWVGANGNSFNQDQFSFGYTVNLSATVEGQPINVALNGSGALDVVNGNGFINITGTAAGSTIDGEIRIIGDQLFARANDPASGADFGWFALDLNELEAANLDTQGLQDSFNAEVFEANGIDPAALLAVGTAFLTVDPEQYISAVRTDEGGTAVFTTNLSLSDLFRADGMTDVTVALGEAFASPLSPGEAAGVNGLAVEVLRDTVLTLEQRVNTATGLVDGASLLVSSQIDPASFGETGAPINVVFTLEIKVSGYGTPATVQAPADFTPVPASAIEAAIAGATGAPPTSGSGGTGSTGGAASGTTTSVPLTNSYSFPTGITFSYPGDYVIQSESDIVTIVQLPNTPSFVQVYDLSALFGDTNMGLEFYQSTYGGGAASTWNFPFTPADFQDVTVNGVALSVLDFVGTQNDQATTGAVVLVPLANGTYTYVQSYAVGSEPPNFRDITLAVAASITG